MGPSTVSAFAALTLAVILLWMPRVPWIWMVPAALALVLALLGGLIDLRGAMALDAFAAASAGAKRAIILPLVIVTLAIMVTIAAGLFLHLVPGFDNARVIADVVVGHGALPYSKFLNFDNGMAG